MPRPGWSKPGTKYHYTSPAEDEYLKSHGASERPNYPSPLRQGYKMGVGIGANAWRQAKQDPDTNGDCIKLKLSAVNFAHLYATADHDVQRMLNEVAATMEDRGEGGDDTYAAAWSSVRQGFMDAIDRGWREFGCMGERVGASGGSTPLPAHKIKLPPGFRGMRKSRRQKRR